MQKQLRNQAGFSHIAVIAAIVVVAGLVGIFTVVKSNASTCVQNTYNVGIGGEPCVARLQKLVNWHNGGAPVVAAQIQTDGDFGPKTKAAVKAFQKHWGLQQDGVVGKKTWAKLCSSQWRKNTSSRSTHASFPTKVAREAGCF